MKIKYIVMSIIAVITLFTAVSVALACYQPPVECGECITPTPTDVQVNPTEEVSPTAEITPSPTDEVKVTPTEGPKGDDRGDYHATTAKAPAPVVCTIPFESPKVWYTNTNGQVAFHWATDAQVEKFSIVYGYSPDALVYGVDNITPTTRSLDIKGLEQGKHTWFSVWAWHDGCAEKSQIIDP